LLHLVGDLFELNFDIN